MKSLLEMRWENVVRQHLEIGCGAAALATILTYHFDFPATEQEMADALWADATRNRAPGQVQVTGFSMKNLLDVAQKGGLIAAGFRVAPEDLDKLRIPAIAQVVIKGYNHFVVVRGAQNGHVFVADPTFGNTSYRLPDFEKIWSGVLLGFVTKTPSQNPLDALALDDGDKNGTSAEQRKRIPRLLPADLTRLARQGTVRVSLFPLMSPKIEGLESALPSLVATRISF